MNIICNVILNPLISEYLDSCGGNVHIVKVVEEKKCFPKVLIILFHILIFLFCCICKEEFSGPNKSSWKFSNKIICFTTFM